MNIQADMTPLRAGAAGTRLSGQMRAIVIETLALMAVMIAVVGAVAVDVALLGNRMTEVSLTELLQATLIAMSALIFAWHARQDAQARGYYAACATLFACMFVRENDAHLDMIWHGFWVVPGGAVALAGFTLVRANRHTLRGPFVQQFTQRHTTFIFIGLLLLLVFSRLFGTGALWEAVMGAAYDGAFKTTVQEGLELLGYGFIGYGALLSVVWRRARPAGSGAHGGVYQVDGRG